MTRVLFVCPNLKAGGAERHWSLLLPRLSQLGLDAHVLTLDDRGPFYFALEDAGIAVATVADTRRWRNLAGLAAILRDPADVIVSRATSADGLSLVARHLRPGVCWVVNWHNPSGMAIPARRREVLRRVLPRADRVVAVCSSQAGDLTALGVRAQAVTVISNGTDFIPREDARAMARRELGLAEDEVAILHVGRLEAQKRVDRFIEAVARAQRQAPHIVGLIAGVGPEQGHLEAMVARLGSRIRFLGRRDDMPEVLAAADVLCLMSDYEALPFVVLEAMASCRPVVATNVGGLADVVVQGETGVLVPREDVAKATEALLQLADEPELRARMGASGRARQATLYTADAMSRQYATALTGLARRSPRAGHL